LLPPDVISCPPDPYLDLRGLLLRGGKGRGGVGRGGDGKGGEWRTREGRSGKGQGREGREREKGSEAMGEGEGEWASRPPTIFGLKVALPTRHSIGHFGDGALSSDVHLPFSNGGPAT